MAETKEVYFLTVDHEAVTPTYDLPDRTKVNVFMGEHVATVEKKDNVVIFSWDDQQMAITPYKKPL